MPGDSGCCKHTDQSSKPTQGSLRTQISGPTKVLCPQAHQDGAGDGTSGATGKRKTRSHVRRFSSPSLLPAEQAPPEVEGVELYFTTSVHRSRRREKGRSSIGPEENLAAVTGLHFLMPNRGIFVFRGWVARGAPSSKMRPEETAGKTQARLLIIKLEVCACRVLCRQHVVQHLLYLLF